jgi:hypothetical protein
MPHADIRIRLLARWRVLLSTIVHIGALPWIIGYCIRHRCSPIVLAYVNARTPVGLDPSQSKNAFFKAIEKRDPTLAALYPRTLLVPASIEFDDREKLVKDFLMQHGIGYPIVAKPDRGSRSFGAYRVNGGLGLQYLLERINDDYLIQEYCEGPIEAGLYFLRSPDENRPSQYGIAVKHDAYFAAVAPHPELTPLRTRFLCDDQTARLTPALEQMMRAFADTAPFDMGRLDVRAQSLGLLLAEPRRMQVLEVNVGFTAADLHVTDLRHPLTTRLSMTIQKWNDALRLGEAYYAAASAKIGILDGFKKCLRYGLRLGSIHKEVYRQHAKVGNLRPSAGRTKSTAPARVG